MLVFKLCKLFGIFKRLPSSRDLRFNVRIVRLAFLVLALHARDILRDMFALRALDRDRLAGLRAFVLERAQRVAQRLELSLVLRRLADQRFGLAVEPCRFGAAFFKVGGKRINSLRRAGKPLADAGKRQHDKADVQRLQLVLQFDVFLLPLGLDAHRLDARGHVVDHRGDALQVRVGVREALFRFLTAVAVFRDTGRLVEDLAALLAFDV